MGLNQQTVSKPELNQEKSSEPSGDKQPRDCGTVDPKQQNISQSAVLNRQTVSTPAGVKQEQASQPEGEKHGSVADSTVLKQQKKSERVGLNGQSTPLGLNQQKNSQTSEPNQDKVSRPARQQQQNASATAEVKQQKISQPVIRNELTTSKPAGLTQQALGLNQQKAELKPKMSRPEVHKQKTVSRPTQLNQDTVSKPAEPNQEGASKPAEPKQQSASHPSALNQGRVSQPSGLEQQSLPKPTEVPHKKSAPARLNQQKTSHPVALKQQAVPKPAGLNQQKISHPVVRNQRLEQAPKQSLSVTDADGPMADAPPRHSPVATRDEGTLSSAHKKVDAAAAAADEAESLKGIHVAVNDMATNAAKDLERARAEEAKAAMALAQATRKKVSGPYGLVFTLAERCGIDLLKTERSLLEAATAARVAAAETSTAVGSAVVEAKERLKAEAAATAMIEGVKLDVDKIPTVLQLHTERHFAKRAKEAERKREVLS
ncbi:MAG: hypothetical protein SGPRY_001926 [Prymnesium sp.]